VVSLPDYTCMSAGAFRGHSFPLIGLPNRSIS
jgi:hypothetical protein